jgi:hypothetical protein
MPASAPDGALLHPICVRRDFHPRMALAMGFQVQAENVSLAEVERE